MSEFCAGCRQPVLASDLFGREIEARAGLRRHPLIDRFSPVLPPRVNIPLAKENLHLVISVARDSAADSLVIQLLIAFIIQRLAGKVNRHMLIF